MLITIVKAAYSEEEAKSFLLSKEPTIKTLKAEIVYYPYYRVIFSIKTKLLTKKVNGHVICTVDAVNGVESIANSHGDMETIEADKAQVIDIKVCEEDALKKASLFTSKVVMQKMKVLNVPTIQPELTEIFYKPFYIVQCRNRRNEDLFILFDAVSAQFSLLDS
jgi:ACT domain-containing protein